MYIGLTQIFQSMIEFGKGFWGVFAREKGRILEYKQGLPDVIMLMEDLDSIMCPKIIHRALHFLSKSKIEFFFIPLRLGTNTIRKGENHKLFRMLLNCVWNKWSLLNVGIYFRCLLSGGVFFYLNKCVNLDNRFDRVLDPEFEKQTFHIPVEALQMIVCYSWHCHWWCKFLKTVFRFGFFFSYATLTNNKMCHFRLYLNWMGKIRKNSTQCKSHRSKFNIHSARVDVYNTATATKTESKIRRKCDSVLLS